jgi:hypothetical protein
LPLNLQHCSWSKNQTNLKIMKKFVGIVSFLLIFSVSALMAQSQTTRTDVRQSTQRARIVDGRVDGEVTRGEARRLRMEQRHIRRAERRTKVDGVVTPREKRRLERKQNRANRHVRRAKHNNIERKD